MTKYPEAQIVRVVNEGDRAFVAGHAGRKYRIESGSQEFVPWEAMCLWVGDPNSSNDPSDRRLMFRQKERDRLSVKWGVYDDPWYAADQPTAPRLPGEKEPEYEVVNGHWRHPNLPKLAVYLADGTRVVTVVDDPDGDADTRPVVEQADRLQFLEQQIAALTSQLESHRNQQLLAGPVNEAEPVPVPVGVATEDTPPAARRKRG